MKLIQLTRMNSDILKSSLFLRREIWSKILPDCHMFYGYIEDISSYLELANP